MRTASLPPSRALSLVVSSWTEDAVRVPARPLFFSFRFLLLAPWYFQQFKLRIRLLTCWSFLSSFFGGIGGGLSVDRFRGLVRSIMAAVHLIGGFNRCVHPTAWRGGHWCVCRCSCVFCGPLDAGGAHLTSFTREDPRGLNPASEDAAVPGVL